MITPGRHLQALGLMVLATLLWSIAGVVSRQMTHAQGFEVTFWRSFFTVLSLSVLLPWFKGRALFTQLPWREKNFWLSAVCWSVMFTAFMLALTMTTVANVLITMAMGPMFTALLSRWWLKKPLAMHTWWAIGPPAPAWHSCSSAKSNWMVRTTCRAWPWRFACRWPVPSNGR